jgi:hypothetical protein
MSHGRPVARAALSIFKEFAVALFCQTEIEKQSGIFCAFELRYIASLFGMSDEKLGTPKNEAIHNITQSRLC